MSILFLPGRYGRRLQYRSHTIVYRRVGSGMRVRWRLTKARHAAISLEVVEWSGQLRSVTSVWLGAVRRSVQVRLCTSGCKSEKMFFNISPLRDLLPSIVLIKSRPSLAVFLLSSLRLSYFFWVAMVVGCSIAVTP